MIDIREARNVYAKYIGEHAEESKSLDAALMHVIEWTYNRSYAQGFADGVAHKDEEGFMGDANRRGSFEQRKAEAIEKAMRKRAEDAHKARTTNARRQYGTLMAMAAIAYGVTLPPRLRGTVQHRGR